MSAPTVRVEGEEIWISGVSNSLYAGFCLSLEESEELMEAIFAAQDAIRRRFEPPLPDVALPGPDHVFSDAPVIAG